MNVFFLINKNMKKKQTNLHTLYLYIIVIFYVYVSYLHVYYSTH